MTVAEVNLWGKTIGAVSWDDDQAIANFEYDPAFIESGREIAPLMMPLSDQIFSFPALVRETFYGLPGLLADSLPDRFGNTLIDAWLASQGRTGCSKSDSSACSSSPWTVRPLACSCDPWKSVPSYSRRMATRIC